MKNKNLIALVLLLVSFSCTDNKDKEDFLTLSQESILLDTNGSPQEIKITSNSGEWQIDELPDWLEVKHESKSTVTHIEISALPNVNFEERKHTITFYNNATSATLQVTQQGLASLDEFIRLSTPKVTSSPWSQKSSIEVTSNTVWQIVDIPSWVTVTPTSGKGSATIEIVTSNNDESEGRSATLKIEGKIKEEMLFVSQGGQKEVYRSTKLPIFDIQKMTIEGYNRFSIETKELFINKKDFSNIYMARLMSHNMPTYPNIHFFNGYTYYPITVSTNLPEVYRKEFMPSWETQNTYAQEILKNKPEPALKTDNGSVEFYTYKQLRAIGLTNFGIKLDVLLNNEPYTQIEMNNEKGMIYSFKLNSFSIDMNVPENLKIVAEDLKKEDKQLGVSYVSSITYGKIGLMVVQTSSNLNDVRIAIDKKIAGEALSPVQQTLIYGCKLSLFYLDNNGLDMVEGEADSVLGEYILQMNAVNDRIVPITFSLSDCVNHTPSTINYSFELK